MKNAGGLAAHPRGALCLPPHVFFLSILAIHISSQQVEVLTRERAITAAELNRLAFLHFLKPRDPDLHTIRVVCPHPQSRNGTAGMPRGRHVWSLVES